jgi:hypothetical protein
VCVVCMYVYSNKSMTQPTIHYIRTTQCTHLDVFQSPRELGNRLLLVGIGALELLDRVEGLFQV